MSESHLRHGGPDLCIQYRQHVRSLRKEGYARYHLRGMRGAGIAVAQRAAMQARGGVGEEGQHEATLDEKGKADARQVTRYVRQRTTGVEARAVVAGER